MSATRKMFQKFLDDSVAQKCAETEQILTFLLICANAAIGWCKEVGLLKTEEVSVSMAVREGEFQGLVFTSVDGKYIVYAAPEGYMEFDGVVQGMKDSLYDLLFDI